MAKTKLCLVCQQSVLFTSLTWACACDFGCSQETLGSSRAPFEQDQASSLTDTDAQAPGSLRPPSTPAEVGAYKSFCCWDREPCTAGAQLFLQTLFI
eukprot:scaffold231121_cov15-Tisochrysis_lutea.AAC.2